MNRKRSRGKSSKRQSVGEPSKRASSPNELWTEKEERLLYEAIEDPGENKCWEDIIERIQKEVPTFDHDPDDCLRYFKHYINPSWYSEEWPTDQGFFLCVLTKVYGHDWIRLADLLQEKNPLTLKNYFYSYMSKAMKHANNNYIPWAVLDKPANFFEWVQMLDEIQGSCLKRSSIEESKRTMELLKKVQLDSKKLREYCERVFRRFREVQGEEKLPIGLVIDLGIVNIRGVEARTLIKSVPAISAAVKNIITINFAAPELEEEQRKEKKNFQFPVYRSMLPVYVFKQSIPEPIVYQNVSNYPPQIMLPPQAGIMMPQERLADQKRKNETNNTQRKDAFK
jgi:hypothetical protein